MTARIATATAIASAGVIVAAPPGVAGDATVGWAWTPQRLEAHAYGHTARRLNHTSPRLRAKVCAVYANDYLRWRLRRDAVKVARQPGGTYYVKTRRQAYATWRGMSAAVAERC